MIQIKNFVFALSFYGIYWLGGVLRILRESGEDQSSDLNAGTLRCSGPKIFWVESSVRRV
jgi:hypothetical protein